MFMNRLPALRKNCPLGAAVRKKIFLDSSI